METRPTGLGSQRENAMTVFSGTSLLGNLQKYYGIISGMLLDPGFRDDDFNRLRTDAINFLKESLRGNNDEELGKEALYVAIYNGNAYGHQNVGPAEPLHKPTAEDSKNF